MGHFLLLQPIIDDGRNEKNIKKACIGIFMPCTPFY